MPALRPLKPEDVEVLAEWEKKQRPYPWSKKNFLDTFHSDRHFILVWEVVMGPRGFVAIQKTDGEAYILNIMIDPLHQKKGWGTQLLKMALDWCRENQVKIVKLDVDAQNFPAINIYQKAGFRIDGARPNAYPRGETGYVMTKNLD